MSRPRVWMSCVTSTQRPNPSAALRHGGGANAAGERNKAGRETETGRDAAEGEIGIAASDGVHDTRAERGERKDLVSHFDDGALFAVGHRQRTAREQARHA